MSFRVSGSRVYRITVQCFGMMVSGFGGLFEKDRARERVYKGVEDTCLGLCS